MRQQSIGIFVTIAILGIWSQPVSAQGSSTTRHNYEACKQDPSPEPDVIEVRRCTGPSGIDVIWTSEPDSSSVDFGDDPLDEEMAIGNVFEVDPTIEWRSGRTARPVAAIARYKVGAGIASLNETRLVVYRIEPSGRSCIMGVVAGGGPSATRKARALIDRSAEKFVCGKSKRTNG
jgi:hypothetical protein